MNLKIRNKTASRRAIFSPRDGLDDQPVSTSFSHATGVDGLVARLLTEQLTAVEDAALCERLRRAAAESASVAWSTAYPLLALPELD